MKFSQRISRKLFILLLVGLLANGSALAQGSGKADKEDKTKTKEAQAVSKQVYEKIVEAQEMVDAKEYQPALRLLNNLYNPDKLTEYEQANVLNYLGYIHYSMDNMRDAIATYKRLLEIPTLELQMAKQTTFTMAQLLTVEDRFQEALTAIDQWFVLETNPAPEPFILKAQILYNMDRFRAMIQPIENAMQVAENRDLPIKEDWYGLLNFAYFSTENYAKVRDIQMVLLQNWPKKRYWISLAGAFTELGQDEKLIYAYDAAFTQGMLEKEREFVTMAQLYLQAEVPYKAAKLMQEKIELGVMEKNEKNYRLLSQAWMLSMEDQKAIPALQAAASLAGHGELDARLANTYLNVGDYSNCVTSARTAARKGGLKSPDNIQISLGMCLYNQRKYNDAKKAFRQAAKVPRSQRTSNQWIRVINAEVERNRQIQLAEDAARKKRKEIDERRANSGRA
jgi:tetratricopeptide (TPR) repeat protein